MATPQPAVLKTTDVKAPLPPTDVKRLRPVVVRTLTAVGNKGRKKFALKVDGASSDQKCDEIAWHPLGVAVKFDGRWYVITNIDHVECEEPSEAAA